jgi:hypothetical protein
MWSAGRDAYSLKPFASRHAAPVFRLRHENSGACIWVDNSHFVPYARDGSESKASSANLLHPGFGLRLGALSHLGLHVPVGAGSTSKALSNG